MITCVICLLSDSYFIYLRTRRPPRSTLTDPLFPYTTLCLSTRTAPRGRLPAGLPGVHSSRIRQPARTGRRRFRKNHGAGKRAVGEPCGARLVLPLLRSHGQRRLGPYG